MESLRKALPEEIALEGLDGITLETLFVRLRNRLETTFDEYLKEEVWNIVKKLKKVDFFEIENDRPTPQIFDRSTDDDEEFNKMFEKDYNIYSFDPVEDSKVQGSCKEFKTRKPVQTATFQELDLSAVQQMYNNKLVIVASQSLRSSMLIPCNLGNAIELPKILYCSLERIGRSRYLGEMSSGPSSLNIFIKDSKSMFYIRRQLIRNKLIWRQSITENKKALNKPAMTRFQLFLPQYFTPIKIPKNDSIEKMHNYLKSIGHAASIDSLMKASELSNRRSVLSLVKKVPNFKLALYPYLQLYPEKKSSTSKSDSTNEKSRKMITGVGLIDSNQDVSVVSKDEEEEVDDEKESFIHNGNQLINMPLAYQIYSKIAATGSEGMSQQEIASYFGLSRLNARAIVKKLKATRGIDFYIKDEGRQRTFKYVTKDASVTAKHEASQQMERMLSNVSDISSHSKDMKKTSQTSSKTNSKNEAKATSAATTEDENEKVIFSMEIPDKTITVSLTRIKFIPGFESSLYEIKKSKNLSEKILTRVNIVLETVKSVRMIDMNQVWNIIRKKESLDEKKEVMCRKSLGKIASSLANEKMIKIVQVELKMETKTLRLFFLCEDQTSLTKEAWCPVIEEKIHNYTYGVLKGIPPPVITQKTFTGINPSEKLKGVESLPKFLKMRRFHEFLFYLIYDCEEEHQKIPIQNVIEKWKKNNPKLLNTSEIDEEIQFCSTKTLNWKTFLTPLTKRDNIPDGWCLIRDIIYRMPLILIANITSRKKLAEFNKTSKEFNELIQHPIKCNYLIHFLPEQMQKQILPVKKISSVVMELCRRLCLFGLLKFGPARGKENDNNFIFINRNASILDTTSSDQGFLEVSDKEYPKSTYHFESFDDLSNFWDNLCDISLRTPLNYRSLSKMEAYNYKQMTSMESMQSYFKPVAFHEASNLDNGEIPGDQKGAGGMDKSFFMFQRRSWLSAGEASTSVKRGVKNTSEKISRVITKRIVAQARNRGGKRTQKSSLQKLSGKSKVIRKSRSEFLNLDSVDKQAMKLSRTTRACWYDSEDKTLILVKVAMKFMFREETPTFDYSVIRDILHWKNEKSLNKTTKMCIRRIANLMKKQSSREKIVLYLEELGNDPQVFCKYRNIAERLKRKYQQSTEYQEVLRIAIVEFVILLHQMFYKRFNSQTTEIISTIELPNDFSEVLQNYIIKKPQFAENLDFKEPNSVEEIEVSALLSFIIGVINVLKEKPNLGSQYMDVFKSLDDNSVRTAISSLRKMSMISMCKRDRNLSYASSSIECYNLSSRYTQTMSVNAQNSLFTEFQDAIKKLSQSKTGHQLNEDSCGWVMLLADMTLADQICFSSEKADRLVTVDPQLRKKSNFGEISDNYLRHQTSKNKGKRRVRLSAGEAYDEIYTFNEHPIDWFLRINVKYLHIFCILVNMNESKEVLIKKFELLDTEWCCLDTCIFQDELDFENVIAGIAENFQGVVRQVLELSQDHDPNQKSKSITKSNLISFFDQFMKSQRINSKNDYRLKVAGKRQEFTTKNILERILDFAAFIPSEDSTWLQDYNKNSKRIEESLEEDDDDISADPITYKKMSNQLKDFNIIRRVNDSFVVNFSAVNAHLKGDLNILNSTEITSVNESLIKYSKWSSDEFSSPNISSKFDLAKGQIAEDIINFIKSKSHNGADVQELCREFHQFKSSLVDIIDLLVKNKDILKTGVNDVRFVDKSFAHYWMISSSSSKKAVTSAGEPEKKKMKHSHSSKKTQEKETVYILPAPWVRVNGTICSHTLDQWLGTLLSHIKMYPGIMMKTLTEKFNILKPFEVRYLCETLEVMGCIQLKCIEKSEVDLFTQYEDVVLGPANFLSANDDIYIEINASAMIKLSCYNNGATNKSNKS